MRWNLFTIEVEYTVGVVMIIVVGMGVQHAVWMRRTCSIGPRKGTCSATSCIGLRAATSSAVLIVFMILGPFPGIIVKSTPMAGRGVKISAQNQSIISKDKKNIREWYSHSLLWWQTWLLHESMRQLFHGPFWRIGRMNAERSFLYPILLSAYLRTLWHHQLQTFSMAVETIQWLFLGSQSAV